VVGVSARGAVVRPRIVLLGAPGSGKGTQAERLSARFGIPRISTGEMLRDNVARGTEAGRQAAPLLAEGRYVPDSVLLPMVRERLAEEDCKDGFILDGFPRTVPQAEVLGRLVGGNRGNFVVVHVDVPRSELLRRLEGRGREDDRGRMMESRLSEHETHTRPVLAWFQENGKVYDVDGYRDVDAVTADLVSFAEACA
jgi:adenylate kinase